MNSESVARRGRRPGDLRVVARRPAKLPRTLGPSALFGACYGNVGSSIYYALGVTAAFALGLTPLALILAGFIFVTTALNYAEGTAALPHAGGSSSFARRAFNAPIGYIVGWVQLLNYTATVSISAYFAISYLGFLGKYVGLLDPLKSDATTHVAATMALIAFLIVVNVIGIQESSILNLVLAFTDLITQLVLVILGIIILLDIQRVIQSIHWGIAPTWGNFLAGTSIAMVTYTGIETISNLSEEAKDPGRNVPLATWWVIVAVLFVSAFLPTIGVSVFPVSYDPHTHAYTTQLATTWKADPVAGIVTGFPQEALRYWAQIWVGILAFTILVIATNAGLIGISRLSYSMAGADLLPHRLARAGGAQLLALQAISSPAALGAARGPARSRARGRPRPLREPAEERPLPNGTARADNRSRGKGASRSRAAPARLAAGARAVLCAPRRDPRRLDRARLCAGQRSCR